MTNKEFNEVLGIILKEINSKLASKGKEYTEGDERFSNFISAGQKLNCSKERALIGMDIKHQVSIDMLINFSLAGVHVTKEMILEKFVDHIDYMILLAAMMWEHSEKNPPVTTTPPTTTTPTTTNKSKSSHWFSKKDVTIVLNP